MCSLKVNFRTDLTKQALMDKSEVGDEQDNKRVREEVEPFHAVD